MSRAAEEHDGRERRAGRHERQEHVQRPAPTGAPCARRRVCAKRRRRVHRRRDARHGEVVHRRRLGLGEAGAQLLGERRHRGKALRRVLGERPLDGGLESRRHVRPPRAEARRRLVHVAERDRDEVVAGERDVAREQLPEHDAERVDVCRRRDRLAARLLGREVLARAEHRTGLRHAVIDVERARDAEVRHLDLALAAEKDVLRLHVTVHEPLAVREGEPVGDRDRELERLRAPATAPTARRAP